MKIYTKTGDTGSTSLYDGSRAPKFSIVFNVIGEIDELNSRIGLLCTYMTDTDMLRKIQRTLQDFNSHIATIDKTNKKLPDLSETLILELENMIDEMEKMCPKLTKFILPGVTTPDALAHLCRTQARKAERWIVDMHFSHKVNIPEIIIKYMNRLSDFFFVFARWICVKSGNTDCFI
jgi:cob(I)alamin adenosyltransferase